VSSCQLLIIEELECLLNQLQKYLIEILLGGFSIKVQREGIFKHTVGNESLHEISNDNGVSVFKLSHIKKSVMSTIFPHCIICKYTWTSPDGKIHDLIMS